MGSSSGKAAAATATVEDDFDKKGIGHEDDVIRIISREDKDGSMYLRTESVPPALLGITSHVLILEGSRPTVLFLPKKQTHIIKSGNGFIICTGPDVTKRYKIDRDVWTNHGQAFVSAIRWLNDNIQKKDDGSIRYGDSDEWIAPLARYTGIDQGARTGANIS